MIYRRIHPRLAASTFALAALLLSSAAPTTQAYPEPSKSPISWELKFDYQPPMRIVVEIPGSPVPKAYWYMTYTVTNGGDQDQNFLPTFEWVSHTGKVTRSDQAVPDAVFQKIKAKTGNTLLENAVKIEGTIHVGDDQAKDGVAIWPETDARVGEFTIFVTGLSGESTPMTDSSDKPMADKDGKPVLLFKSTQIDYKLAGDEVYPGNDLLTKIGQRWVMR